LVREWIRKKKFREQAEFGRKAIEDARKEMNDPVKALESEYRKCGEAFGAAVKLGDADASNKNFRRRAAIVQKLRACGKPGEAVLRRLMKDRSDAVAVWAATDSLRFAEVDALEVLDAIANKKGLIPFDARIIAEQWRAGELKIR